MRSLQYSSILFSSILVLISIQFLLSVKSSAQENNSKPSISNIQLPRIFDWNRYKVSFHKIYPTIKDELIRKKLFLANALKTFLHNLAFRLGKSSHYLSINQFTDYTPNEIKRMYSGLKLDGDFNSISNSNETKDKSDSSSENQEVDLDLGQLQQELAGIIKERQPGFEIVARELGVKIDDAKNRSNNSDKKKKMKSSNRTNQYERKQNRLSKEDTKTSQTDMDINEFRSITDEIAPEESDKFVQNVASTNDHYQSIDRIELNDESLDRKHVSDEKIGNLRWQIPGANYVRNRVSKLLSHYFSQNQNDDKSERSSGPDEKGSNSFVSHSDGPLKIGNSKIVDDDKGLVRNNMVNLSGQAVSADVDKSDLEDKIYFDWRSSGCLTVTRDQNKCGCCYAFASIAIMEFLHCKQTGNLVPFSEQYMIDCGLSHVEQLQGCNGAQNVNSMAVFLMNWGVQLLSDYPYYDKETQCPYKSEDWVHASYKRPSMKQFKTIEERVLWPGLVESTGPMLGVITIPKDFPSYGGKVHEGNNCDISIGLHAMPLVGHGIEDGQEYWLYRNSHGYTWGEEGYFKLSKLANNNCFGPHTIVNFDFGEESEPVEIVEGNEQKRLTPFEAYMRKLNEVN